MNGTRTCFVDGCRRNHVARGMCQNHYAKWRRSASDEERLLPTRSESFWANVDRSSGPDGCWYWKGCITDTGYGLFGVGARTVRAHRYAYLSEFGIEAVGQVDHTCHNLDPDCGGGDSCAHRRCVNPRHLEDVPQAENIARGRAGIKQSQKTHCRNGHEYSAENTIYPLRPNGKRNERVCRECRKAAQKKYNSKRKAA